jgi:hypothetical protein
MTEREQAIRLHVATNHTTSSAQAVPPYGDHIALLFHATRTNQLNDILAQGLDSRMGNGGLLGRGIYFSDSPQKSMQYDANRTVLLCRIIDFL